MREYTVIKEILNVRNKASDEDDNTYVGNLLLGDTVWLDEKEIVGTIPKGGTTNIWLSRNGTGVVAKDGVRPKSYEDKKAEFVKDEFNESLIDKTDPNNESKWKVSWGHVDLEIWKIWRDYNKKGENVTIGIIDTGISVNRNPFQNRIIDELSYSVIDKSKNVNDDIGHGTKVAGIILANDLNNASGVAPKSKAIIVKANRGFFYTTEDVAAALEYLKDKSVDIISISIELPKGSQRLLDSVQGCIKNGKIIVAAVGDVIGKFDRFPASYNNIISTGAYFLDDQLERLHYSEGSSKSDIIKCVAPGKNIPTIDNIAKPAKFSNSSASTAFIAGSLGLVLSAVETKNRPSAVDIINRLPSVCSHILTGQAEWNDTEGFGVFNPIKLLEALKIKINI